MKAISFICQKRNLHKVILLYFSKYHSYFLELHYEKNNPQICIGNRIAGHTYGFLQKQPLLYWQ